MTKKTVDLGRDPVGQLLFSLAVPAITAQIINVLYNIIDRMYIGHIPGNGSMALTGVGVALPVIMLISAFACLVGFGGAPRAAIAMGKGKTEEAQEILGNCLTTLVIISLILTLVFLLFAKPILFFFGASTETLPYASSYLTIYVCGTLFVQASLGLNPFITAQGFAKTGMATVLIGAVANIILDPLFIYGLHWGVQGAALATILSQGISALWVFRFLTGGKTKLRLQGKYLRPRSKILLPVLALGISPFIMQGTESILLICYNTSLYRYGNDIAVGSMTILSSIMQFSMLPAMGLTQGAGPIISFNYGARNPVRIRKTFRILLFCCLGYTTVLWALSVFTPSLLVGIFTNEETLLTAASSALRLYMGASLLMGAQIACQQTFIALGNAKASLFLALLRKVVLLIPLIYLLPHLLPGSPVTSVFLAEPVADTLAVITTISLFAVQFHKSLNTLEEPAQ